MKAISYSSPNGNVLVLVLSDAGKLTNFICEPVNRTKLLEWLLLNNIDTKAAKAIMEFVESESQAARQSVESGEKKTQNTGKAEKKTPVRTPSGK